MFRYLSWDEEGSGGGGKRCSLAWAVLLESGGHREIEENKKRICRKLSEFYGGGRGDENKTEKKEE